MEGEVKMENEKLLIDALQLQGKPFHRGGVTFQKCLLPFRRDTHAPGLYTAEPQRLFHPRGLAVWGAPPGSQLAFSLISNQIQAVVSLGSVPARFFAFGDSYEQIAKKLDEGSEPPTWCDWDVVRPGTTVRLEFSDLDNNPLTVALELAMWGVAAL